MLLLLLLLLLPPPPPLLLLPPPPPPPLPPLTMRHRAQPYRAPASSSALEMDSLTRRYRRPSPPCARAIVWLWLWQRRWCVRVLLHGLERTQWSESDWQEWRQAQLPSRFKGDLHWRVVALACLFLAGKVEDNPKKIYDVVVQFYSDAPKREPLVDPQLSERHIRELKASLPQKRALSRKRVRTRASTLTTRTFSPAHTYARIRAHTCMPSTQETLFAYERLVMQELDFDMIVEAPIAFNQVQDRDPRA